MGLVLMHQQVEEIKLKISGQGRQIFPLKQADHCVKVRFIHTKGTKKEETIAPTTPVSNKVNKGLSELCNLRVIIKYIP